jgi:acyl-CoA thioesterase I
MVRGLLLSGVASLVLLGVPSAPRAANLVNEPHCQMPPDMVRSDEPLRYLADAIRKGGDVDILAVGSASTAGRDLASPDNAFPYQMILALEQTMPGVKFHLTVRGERGLTAEGMLPLILDALQTQHFPLVLWQTGTVEAVRGLPPEELAQTVERGAQAVGAQGGTLVLVDAQFSRFLKANSDVDAYEAALKQVAAALPGVILFHRYDLTRDWTTEEQLDLEHIAKSDRRTALDALHVCLGQALARVVLNGVAQARKVATAPSGLMASPAAPSAAPAQ